VALEVFDDPAEHLPQRHPDGFAGRAGGQVLGELLPEDLVLAHHQLFLRREVAEERAFGHSGRRRQVVDGGLVVTLFDEQVHVEMAQVLKEFENDYEFTFATPDGNAPQLDINGMALSVQSIEKTGAKTLPMRRQQRRRSYDVSSFRQRHPDLVARREQEVQLLER